MIIYVIFLKKKKLKNKLRVYLGEVLEMRFELEMRCFGNMEKKFIWSERMKNLKYVQKKKNQYGCYLVPHEITHNFFLNYHILT